MELSVSLAFLGTLLAVGLWIDQATQRDRQGRETQKEDQTEFNIYRDALLSSYALIYERVLGPRFFSWKSFFVVAVYYTAIFAVVTLVAKPDWFEFSEIPTEFIAICILGGFFTTWISVQQTRIFSYEAIFSESRFARFVFVISDLLTSSNLIIYLYSAFVAFAAFSFQTLTLSSEFPEEKLEVRVFSLKIDNRVIEDFGLQVNSDYQFSYYISLFGRDPRDEWESRPNLTMASDSPFLSPGAILAIASGELIEFEPASVRFLGFSRAELQNDARLLTGSLSTLIEDVPEISLSELEALTLDSDVAGYSIDFTSTEIFSGSYSGDYYRKAFRSVDEFEDSFWGISAPLFASWAGGVADPRDLNFNRFQENLVDCDGEWHFVFDFPVGHFDNQDCEEHIFNGAIEGLNSFKYSGVSSSLARLNAPVAPIVYAGMLPSLLFYMSIVAYVCFVALGRSMLSIPVLRSLVLYTPFSLSFVSIGLAVCLAANVLTQ